MDHLDWEWKMGTYVFRYMQKIASGESSSPADRRIRGRKKFAGIGEEIVKM